jgi:hypothetical protein
MIRRIFEVEWDPCAANCKPAKPQVTAAGRVFLHHARLALSQIETAGEVARRAEQTDKPIFVIAPREEVAWLPESLRIIRQEAPGIEVPTKRAVIPGRGCLPLWLALHAWPAVALRWN